MRFNSFTAVDLKVAPKKLKVATKEVLEKHEDVMGDTKILNDWNHIYEKIKTHRRLSFRELKYSLTKIEELDENCVSFLGDTFRKYYLTEDFTRNCFSHILRSFRPWPVVQFFFSIFDQVDSSENLREEFAFHLKHREKVEISASFDEFCDLLFENVSSVGDLRSFLTLSLEAEKAIISYVRKKPLPHLFKDKTNALLTFLLEALPVNEFPVLIERYLSVYFAATPNWSALILQPDNPLNILVRFVLNSNLLRRDYGERLLKVFQKYELAKDAISELKKISVERGEYWEGKLRAFDKIEVRKFGKGLIALAMFTNRYVIVEFAPSGNAAFFYKEENFKEIQDSVTWKSNDHAGISISRNGYFANRALRDLKNGRFIHSHNWTKKMDKVLKVLSNV